MPTLTRTSAPLLVSREDRKLVDEAIATISRIWRAGLLGTVVAAGDYLRDAFFDGSVDRALAHGPAKPVALRHLYQRVDELPFGIHQLRIAIRVAAQWHRMPARLADGLTVTHHEVLLPLERDDDKERLARRAVDEALTAEALARLVRKLAPPRRGGRPAAAPVRLWVNSVVRAVDADALKKVLGNGELHALAPAERKKIEADLREARAAIDRVIDACTKATKRLTAG